MQENAIKEAKELADLMSLKEVNPLATVTGAIAGAAAGLAGRAKQAISNGVSSSLAKTANAFNKAKDAVGADKSNSLSQLTVNENALVIAIEKATKKSNNKGENTNANEGQTSEATADEGDLSFDGGEALKESMALREADHRKAIAIIQKLEQSEKAITVEDVVNAIKAADSNVDISKISKSTVENAVKDINKKIEKRTKTAQTQATNQATADDKAQMQKVLGSYANDPSWQAIYPAIKSLCGLKEMLEMSTILREAYSRMFEATANWKQWVQAGKPIDDMPDQLVSQMFSELRDCDALEGKQGQMALSNCFKSVMSGNNAKPAGESTQAASAAQQPTGQAQSNQQSQAQPQSQSQPQKIVNLSGEEVAADMSVFTPKHAQQISQLLANLSQYLSDKEKDAFIKILTSKADNNANANANPEQAEQPASSEASSNRAGATLDDLTS